MVGSMKGKTKPTGGKAGDAAPGFAPKKNEEQYNTLFGVNERMTNSKHNG